MLTDPSRRHADPDPQRQQGAARPRRDAELAGSRCEIARILKEEGYIRDYQRREDRALPYEVLVVELKYGRKRERVLSGLKRISKPGRRIYAGKDRLPRVLGGMGTAILSTSRGVITSRTAEAKGVGGEVICFIW